MNNFLGKTARYFGRFFSTGFLLLLQVTNTFSIENILENTIARLERNDPTLTSVRFWNFGEPSTKATFRLFTALGNNTHLQSIEVSTEAGMGQEAELGIRLSDACLKRYSTNVKEGTTIKKWIVNDKSVRALANSMRTNNSLTTIHFANALFANQHLVDLGTAIKAKNRLRSVTLGIDLNSTVAVQIIQNVHLTTLNLDDNVDLTIPEDNLRPFFQAVHEHPNLRSLSLKECGELYMYTMDLAHLRRLTTVPTYHLKTLTTDVNINEHLRNNNVILGPLANYTLAQQPQASDDVSPDAQAKRRRVSRENDAVDN